MYYDPSGDSDPERISMEVVRIQGMFVPLLDSVLEVVVSDLEPGLLVLALDVLHKGHVQCLHVHCGQLVRRSSFDCCGVDYMKVQR